MSQDDVISALSARKWTLCELAALRELSEAEATVLLTLLEVPVAGPTSTLSGAQAAFITIYSVLRALCGHETHPIMRVMRAIGVKQLLEALDSSICDAKLLLVHAGASPKPVFIGLSTDSTLWGIENARTYVEETAVQAIMQHAAVGTSINLHHLLSLMLDE